MALYHFSDDPLIERFVPRPSRLDGEPFVWAIDEWHAPLYFVPRDCPRVCFWPLPTTTPEDFERFFAYVPARMVIAIEAAWLDRLRATCLYRYLMPDESFIALDDAWMYVSRETVVPLHVDTLDDLPARLVEAGVELRICSSLVPLAHAAVASTLHFSLIRMRNAIGWDGPPVPEGAPGSE